MALSNILLVLAFLIGCIGIARAGLGVSLSIVSCLALGAVLSLIGWWINSPSRSPAGSPTNADVVKAFTEASERQADESSKMRAALSKTVDATPEAQLSGVLMPANEPDAFKCDPELPSDSMKVFLGPWVAFDARIGTHKIVRIGDEDIVTMKCTSDGLFVSAIIRRDDSREVARITDNKITINPNNYFESRRIDRHEMQVFGKSGMVFRVRYLNENAVYLEGTFCGSNHQTVTVTKDAVRYGTNTLGRSVIGPLKGICFSFD